MIFTCTWEEDDDGVWHTECLKTFETTNGTPSKNGFAYCCYCGATLLEAPYDELEGIEDES